MDQFFNKKQYDYEFFALPVYSRGNSERQRGLSDLTLTPGQERVERGNRQSKNNPFNSFKA